MHSLAQAVESVGHQIIPLLLALAALLLLAYQFVAVRDVVLHLFAIARGLLESLAGGLDGLAATLRRAFTELRRHVTDDERIPLPRLIVAVVALAPILFLLVVVEVRLWGAYFESLFPEQLDVPLIGAVPGGLLTALVPIAAGFLLGWLLEAVFGTFPLPILSAARSREAQARARGLLAIALCVLWVLLVATVFDAANEVYDGLGDSTCALRLAPSSDLPVLADSRLVPDAAITPGDAATQAACVADWKANDRARSIRVILGELTLHLSALIAWVVLGAVGLALLTAVGAPAVALALGAWLTRQLARLVGAIGCVAESLLGVLRAIGAGLVRLLRGLGLPAPPAPAPPGLGGQSEPSLVAGAAAHLARRGAADGAGAGLAEHQPDAVGIVPALADRPSTANGVYTAR